MSRPGPFISAEEFADSARLIVETMQGHAAHRAIDLLTNNVLRGLGYGEGIEIFERAVGHWHAVDADYPHEGRCPDCERDRSECDRDGDERAAA